MMDKEAAADASSRPLCVDCGRLPVQKKGFYKGKQRYTSRCYRCLTERLGPQYNSKERKYRPFKKDHCEECGFIAKHPAQLDVDHVDGDSTNNNIDNLRTLCANCHRLKTVLTGEHLHYEMEE